MDQEIDSEEGWSNVILSVERVNKIRIAEGDKTTCVVLSFGLHIKFVEGKGYLDLCSAEPETLEDFEQSEPLVVGEECFWSVAIYRMEGLVKMSSAST